MVCESTEGQKLLLRRRHILKEHGVPSVFAQDFDDSHLQITQKPTCFCSKYVNALNGTQASYILGMQLFTDVCEADASFSTATKPRNKKTEAFPKAFCQFLSPPN